MTKEQTLTILLIISFVITVISFFIYNKNLGRVIMFIGLLLFILSVGGLALVYVNKKQGLITGTL